MTWPPRQPARDEVGPDEVADWDAVVERARRVRSDPERDAGIYGRLLLSPAIAARMSEIGGIARRRGDRGDSYTHADREWVDQVLSVEMSTNVLMPAHLPDAIAVGVTPRDVALLRARRTDELPDRLQVLTAFIVAIHHGTMSEPVWLAAEAVLGERGAVDLAAFTLFLPSVIRAIQMTAYLPEPTDAQVDDLLRDLEAGRLDTSDFRRRIG